LKANIRDFVLVINR